MTAQQFLDFGMAETAGEGSGFFGRNRLVKVCAGLENFSLGTEAEKNVLLRWAVSLYAWVSKCLTDYFVFYSWIGVVGR